MGEKCNIPWFGDLQSTVDDDLAALLHGFGIFPIRAFMAPDCPTRDCHANFRRSHSLVIAVIPFQQFGHHLGLLTEAAQLAGPTSSLQRGAENGGKGLAFQHRRQLTSFLLSLRQQRKVGAAGVPSVLGPFSSSMTQEPELTMFGQG